MTDNHADYNYTTVINLILYVFYLENVNYLCLDLTHNINSLMNILLTVVWVCG